MRQSLKFLLFLVLAGVLVSTNVYATNILDNYVGADAHGRGDVIGREDLFDISSADVLLSGTTLTVDIHTNFAGKGDDGLFGSLTGGKGIGYGDLFLASSWNPNGSVPYALDDNSNGTIWTYAIGLGGDRWNTAGGSATLYSLASNNNNSDALLSEDFLSGGTYRNGQEVAVDTSSAGVRDLSLTNSASWSINEAAGIISFMADISDTSLLFSDEIALHWGETCQNDAIEGSAPVPEPASMLLLGMGLISMASFGRRKFSKK